MVLLLPKHNKVSLVISVQYIQVSLCICHGMGILQRHQLVCATYISYMHAYNYTILFIGTFCLKSMRPYRDFNHLIGNVDKVLETFLFNKEDGVGIDKTIKQEG